MTTSSKRNSIIQEMLSLPKEQKDRVHQDLNSLPVEGSENCIVCDIIDCRLLAPCELNGCLYHINNKQNSNCLRQLKANDKRKLTQAVAADALAMPTEALRDILASALTKIRKASLKERLHEEEGINTFSYVTNTRVCAACAGQVENDNHKHEVLPGHNIYYCSRSCEARRPVAQIKIEMEYKTDVGEVLLIAKKTFHKLDIIQATLGVKKTNLLQWYNNLLGVRPHEFGIDAAAAVDVLRKSINIAPEDSFVSILAVEKTNKWWAEYDARIQDSIMSI